MTKMPSICITRVAELIHWRFGYTHSVVLLQWSTYLLGSFAACVIGPAIAPMWLPRFIGQFLFLICLNLTESFCHIRLAQFDNLIEQSSYVTWKCIIKHFHLLFCFRWLEFSLFGWVFVKIVQIFGVLIFLLIFCIFANILRLGHVYLNKSSYLLS